MLLPEAPPPVERAASDDTMVADAAPPPGTILVVDDEPTVCALLTRVLERRQYPTEAVTSPEAAIQKAEALGENLGMVIST